VLNLNGYGHHALQWIVWFTSLIAATDECCERLWVSLVDRNGKIEILSRSRYSPS
jgi:hypothetical protein